MQEPNATQREQAPEDARPAPPPKPTIFQLAFPSILANLLFSAVAIAQTKFVGELGAEALAAVGVGQRVFFALQAVLMAVSAGTTALVARAWGAGDRDEASRVTMASLAAASVFALALTAPGILAAEPVARVFGLEPRTTELAAINVRWLSAFNLAFCVNFILGAALRAAGDAWSPLWVGIGVNVLNVALLYALVLGRLGFPQLGVAGAAVAGGIAFAAGGAAMLVIWRRQKFRLRYVAGGWCRRERFARLLRIGYPAGLEMGVFQAGYFVFLILVGHNYGTSAFAAYNVGMNLLMACFVLGFGFSIATATLSGQHLGAGDPAAAARSAKRAMVYAVAAMSAVSLAVAALSPRLAGFFLDGEPETERLVVRMTWIMAAAMPMMAVDFALGGALRGAGDTRFPMFATLIALFGARCTLAAAFTWAQWPVAWVFGAMIAEALVKAALLAARFASGRWQRAAAG